MDNLGKGKYNNTYQQDAQEFLTDLIETLHEELSGNLGASPVRLIETTEQSEILPKYEEWKRYYFDKTNHSVVSDMFYAHTLNVLRCQSCETNKYSFGFFSALALEVSNEVLKTARKHSITKNHRKGVILVYVNSVL